MGLTAAVELELCNTGNITKPSRK